MNFYIHRFWFHDEVDHVEEWTFPVEDPEGYGVYRKSPRVHGLGCWALYRVLGRYAP